MQAIIPGKIRIFNIFQQTISTSILANISQNTSIVLIFDTDLKSPNFNIFNKNIEILKKSRNVKNIHLIPQCKNLEDEIIYATTIKKIEDFFPSESNKFKSKFIKAPNTFLYSKFRYHSLEIDKLWSRNPEGVYSKLKNQAQVIKK